MFRVASYTITTSTTKSRITPVQIPRFFSAMSNEETVSEPQHKFMLILGKPGGGKGTISNKILNDFPTFKHLSTGDLLREHVRKQTPIGLQAKEHMDKGDLVPDDVMIQLVLHDATASEDDNGNNDSLLLDGFPRTMEQAVALDKSLEVDLVINLNVPVGTIVERISDRWIHPASGRIYNYSYNPPKTHGKDDITNEDLIQREDDKPETVRKRLEKYDNVTAPLIQYYSNKGILKSFEGTKSDVIYVDVQKWLGEQIDNMDDHDDE
jgi:nucleoside-triphosphate--adenylate kinase